MAIAMAAQVVLSDEASDAAIDKIAALAEAHGAGGRYFRDALTGLMNDRVWPELGMRTLGWGQPLEDVAGIIGERES